MTIVAVSHWLEDIVKQSFLSKYPIKVINNGVDLTSFRPCSDTSHVSLMGDQKFTILGVASSWDDDKGVQEFIKLSQNPDYHVIMVGVKDDLKAKLPKEITAIE